MQVPPVCLTTEDTEDTEFIHRRGAEGAEVPTCGAEGDKAGAVHKPPNDHRARFAALSELGCIHSTDKQRPDRTTPGAHAFVQTDTRNRRPLNPTADKTKLKLRL